jgi:hypothetical protein
MKKLILFLLLMCCPMFATTYYIAASGSDSNNGTAKATPWIHAPGMPSCTATCGSTTPAAGDQFIFRGGDTWHYGTGTPAVGGTWNWTWSGSSTHCDYVGNDTSTCVYIGVDKTWFTGASWVRPIFTGDNAANTSYIASCANAGPNPWLAINGLNYVWADNFEWTGKCWTGANAQVTIDWSRTSPSDGTGHIYVTNMYTHGWTTVTPGASTSDSSYFVHGLANNSGSNPMNVLDKNVMDGSDSHCVAANDCFGNMIYGSASVITNNVFKKVGNGVIANDTVVYAGNLVDSLYEICDTSPCSNGTHGNVMEWNGFGVTCSTIYIYNNLITGTDIGETLDVNVCGTEYAFNNVYDTIGNGANCFMDESANGNNATIKHFNETLDETCAYNLFNTLTVSSTWHGQNLHSVGSPTSFTGLFNNGSSITPVNDGNELFQTFTAASAQGYTTANFYTPGSSGSTIGVGANLTARCSSMTYAPAAAACQAGHAHVTYSTSDHTATVNTGNARPTSGAWDEGAYQFSAASAPPTIAPATGLFAKAIF